MINPEIKENFDIIQVSWRLLVDIEKPCPWPSPTPANLTSLIILQHTPSVIHLPWYDLVNCLDIQIMPVYSGYVATQDFELNIVSDVYWVKFWIYI